MCVIAVSKKGNRLPTESELKSMWAKNSDGAGYMYSKNGYIIIHKGFMFLDDYIRSIRSEHFTEDDSVIFHFRISTQAGISASMTHPFPISNNPNYLKALDLCVKGAALAHNGIIPLTTDRTQTEFSDTALFVQKYLSRIIRNKEDIKSIEVQTMIETLAGNFSKFALMDSDGNIETIGKFFNHNGLLLSNENHIYKPFFYTPAKHENLHYVL